MAANRRVCFFVQLCFGLVLAKSLPAQGAAAVGGNLPASIPFEARVAELWKQLPPPHNHFEGVPESEGASRLRLGHNYQEFLREKMQGSWFAALVSLRPENAFSVQERFESWKRLMDFLLERDALVEVWAYPKGGTKARRIPATEMALLKRQRREQPSFVTVTYRESAASELVTNRVEFSFKAASEVLAASRSYQRHREIQLAAHEVLGRRDAHGKLNATAQWEQLVKAVQSGLLPLAEMPPKPAHPGDLLMAFEYEVDPFNNFTQAVRVYRESEIERRVAQDSQGQSAQILALKTAVAGPPREVRGFRRRGMSDVLEPAPSPVPGQDVIELRVKNASEPDVRKWNVLDFGEPEIVEQSALAKFSLISAYLEKKRKEIAVKKSRLDLIAEPIFAGLNIGGGLAAVGFPIGEAARLAYNAAVVPWFIPDVPSVKQMRELFRLMAAKDKHPELKTKPGRFLDAADFKHLQEATKELTDADVVEYLQHVSDKDLQGMLRLAKMQRIDAQVSNLLSIMADAGKVSGWTDSAGFQRDVFNSIYFSVTGEVGIKNIIAVLVGGSVATPNAGFSLKTLSEGRGPGAAWLQFLNFTVDIRAVVNTVARVSHRRLADKELKKPFPYGPWMSDLAAYEIRIFGFPLLIFYKRGLLKDDYASYLHDYAYGLIGATIVEHFGAREEMDAEIRAGRMVPLGYVRVPNGQGGWKETNLAVFAHRIRAGRNKGKTTIIIYGLKAYEEQSRLMEREYLRFKEFEQALREGGVIERLVDAENREQLPSESFEPTLHPGAKAGEEIYAPLLGGLQELHRYWQQKSWGLPFDPNEAELVAGIFDTMAAKQIWVEDRNPLLGVDRYSSSFQYRRVVGGKWRVMQMTLIPGPAEIERELAKASEGARIEQMRQEAISEQGDGIILLNAAQEVNGHYESGPLLENDKGEVIGFGVRAGAKAMEEVFEQINRLPITDRARLQFNHFASTVVALDVAGSGRAEKVFLTIEFPPDKNIERAWTNPLSGEREILSIETGRLTRVTMERRLTEMDYGTDHQELASRSFFNAGTRERPLKGALLEEARTLDTWHRNLTQPDIDPYQPLLSKLKVNHVTGQISRETYGLFPLPIVSVDEQFITQNKFNAYGLFESAKVLDNGKSEGDFERPLLGRLIEPIAGQERFLLSSTIPPNQLPMLRDLKARGYKTAVEKKDLLKGLAKNLVFDNARWGRRVGESYLDLFDGSASFSVQATSEYRDEFLFGLLPFKSQIKSVPGGVLLAEVAVSSYDPLSRQLTGVEVDATGRTSTKVWDCRWDNPVTVETSLRKTTNRFDRFELSVSGATVSKTSGESVTEFSGRFDSARQRWVVTRNIHHRPAISKRIEVDTLSGFGKLIFTRTGDLFEGRPVYDADGLEIARRTGRQSPVTGEFDLLHRLEEDYQWQQGERNARIQIYVDGKPYDTFRSITDPEGRTIVDAIRQISGCELKTLIGYDGASERATLARQIQNGQTRVTHISQAEQPQPDGSWLLPVTVVPSLGLTATQTFRLGDLLARPLTTAGENGDIVKVTEWFEGTSIAKVSELSDRQGRIKERFVKNLNRGTEGGISFDLTARFTLSYWGTAGLAGEEASIRGTDVALFKRGTDEKVYYDLSKPFTAPWYAVDPQRQDGMEVTLKQAPKSHVLTVFDSRPIESPELRGTNQSREAALLVGAVDLRGLFYHLGKRQVLDRSGKILEEKFGRIPNQGETAYTDLALAQALDRMKPTKQFYYRYAPGWMLEKPDPESSGRMLLFSDKEPGPGTKSFPVNGGRWRELVTQIDCIQATSESASEDPLNSQRYLFRHIHSPREVEHNPYMPDRSGVWTSWTASELGIDGHQLFDAEIIYDGEGRICVSKAQKTTGSGQPATSVAFNLCPPGPGMLQERALDREGQGLSLEQNGLTDFSPNDFVYFYAVSESNAVRSITLADARGGTARVNRGDSDYGRGAISRWPIGSANVQWLPDAIIPRQKTVVNAPASLLRADQVVVISVHDLARAGLEIRKVNSVHLELENRQRVSLSPLLSLSRRGPWLAEQAGKELSIEEHHHSSGIKTFATVSRGRAEREVYAGQGLSSVSEFDGLPIAISRGRAAHAEYPEVIVVDNSDADSSRPLYALSPQEGHFLEYYKMVKLGDAQVYTVARGFALPRLEVFSAKVLADEVAPGFIAYGSDYSVTTRYARGRGVIGQALATLHNRITANAFRFGGERLGRFFRADDTAMELLSHFNYSSLHDAKRQADRINHLPMLAQALLPSRTLPWQPRPRTGTNAATQDWRKVRRTLQALAKLHVEDYRTGLIPTSPETLTERYVDTVQEAGLIILASKLGETGLANDLLKFYWEKSQGGQKALHAAYDAEAGTAKAPDLISERPRHTPRTAEAQLAIADAAFNLGLQTSDPQWLTLGNNLTHLVLEDFRPPPITNGAPRGLCEYQFLPTTNTYGVTLWPEAKRFTLRSNARAYLLFKQLDEALGRLSADSSWRQQVSLALGEEEAWLKTYIVPQVELTGVVPKGLFEIQDINHETTALGVERWTSAEDWLAFLEAADAMGLPRASTRRWLENLARVHGVRVNHIWGLDWSIPLLRAEAISAEATAKFQRLAKRLGHDQAEEFADQNLNLLKSGGAYPVIATEAPPQRAVQSGQGFFISPRTNHQGWPNTLSAYKELIGPEWDSSKAQAPLETKSVGHVSEPPRTDLTVFILITAGFYLSILLAAIFWWRFRALRQRDDARVFPDPLVSEGVLQRAEERWAKRVLGMKIPEGAEKTRFSNAPLEENFLLQLKAIYKLVLEWRRQENGWEENDPRLAEDGRDDWLNGLDEFAALAGLYMRWVIKAGAKDGFSRPDVMTENEDSNHIWSRLVMFLSEYYWGLLTVMRNYNNLVTRPDKSNLFGEMSQLLSLLGIRQRAESFDARKLFNFPADPAAMDLLAIQRPGMTLDKLALEVSRKLQIPYLHFVRLVERYKEFKKRENPYPLHPYLIEYAKVVPHFLLMGLGALIWYNQGIGDSPIVPYLWSVLAKFALAPASLIWALPLLAGLVLSVAAHFVKVYRFDAPMLAREKTDLFLDATVTSLFTKRHSIMPKARSGPWWEPRFYQWAGWSLRVLGFVFLALSLFKLETPSFATFLVVKGMLAMLALGEVAAIALPLAAMALSKFLQDRVTRPPEAGSMTKFLNRLNITATRPASPFWLTIKYHAQPSVPTGGFWGMMQAVVFYFVFAAAFFFVGAFLCQQIFSLWFTDTYLKAADWKLFFGGLIFWNTMYLLRYGLFLMFSGVASMLATFPIKSAFGLLALAQLLVVFFGPALPLGLSSHPNVTYPLVLIGLLVIIFEKPITDWVKRVFSIRSPSERVDAEIQNRLPRIKREQSATLGVVFMSGDDLASQKLTPELLMARWNTLRDKLNSSGLHLLSGMAGHPDDATLRKGFEVLYEAEKAADVTLWHPMQIVAETDIPALDPELSLNLTVENAERRTQLVTAWHLRRWLVTMMSTAGHSQDTAINLVDIALRLDREGLSANTVFYLIQNKYDNSEHNRPSQTPYHKGELNQRNKLARLLMAVAPGARAYNIQDWTPFGFKAGALTGMDFAYEESLKLTTMLLLDRNATVHDLDALMHDLTRALTDPDVVIIIPGRGTTNTLTPLGQGSQMVEEGHRSFLRGVLTLLGGSASEAVGTGWGNILAVSYGRVLRAMVDAHSAKMPLTSRMQRGSSFAVRAEGLIGFAPHAVGISEDTWAVSQAAHNAMALGSRVKFLPSRALWHKIRETWSHSEWLASFPRWSGGYLQMMHDPLMQRINDFGAQSVFAKEVRANSGRNFLSAPFALLNILLLPLAIMLDVTPFIQILILLWNFGFVMNQILTVHGLNTYLESSGFYRIPAALGAVVAGGLPLFAPRLAPYAPGLILLGCLTGGFLVGLSRWLYTRVRDIILFGPQLVLHALGQVVRQSLEFVVSGASPEDVMGVNMAFRAWAGPREDRPFDTFPNFLNLKTVVWVVGLLSVILNLFALSNLDMLNVLLLLPSLLFSVSMVIGPFVLRPPLGRPLGQWAMLPRILGWGAAFTFFTLVSMLVAAGGWFDWMGLILFCSLFALLLRQALSYALFRPRLRRAKNQLTRILESAGIAAEERVRQAQRILRQALGGPAAVRDELEGLPAAQQEAILKLVRERIHPLLKAPVQGRETVLTAKNRWVSEFGRSLALALFVLLWFFIVPVPGLLVFTAGAYRFSLGLGTILFMVTGSIGFVLLAFWIGKFIQWIDHRGLGGRGLRLRLEKAYRAFDSRLAAPGQLTAPDIASTFALFTDAQTYIDQRSYAYARRSLAMIEGNLSRANRG